MGCYPLVVWGSEVFLLTPPSWLEPWSHCSSDRLYLQSLLQILIRVSPSIMPLGAWAYFVKFSLHRVRSLCLALMGGDWLAFGQAPDNNTYIILMSHSVSWVLLNLCLFLVKHLTAACFPTNTPPTYTRSSLTGTVSPVTIWNCRGRFGELLTLRRLFT